jgi:CIC family chloride channel protein
LKTIVKQALLLREKIPHKTLVLLLAVLVGFSAGLAAVLIKNSVHLIQYIITFGFAQNIHNFLYFVYPLIGLFLTYIIVKKLLLDKHVGHGIPNTLYAISKRNSIIHRISMFNSIITSALTVGFGGSVGLEGPTVGTSAAIGSNIGRAFRVNYKTKTLLIGCAASGALAAIFKAPIAAIVFAIEVIMLDLTMASLIPLMLASVAASLTSNFFFGEDVLFHFPLKEGFDKTDIVFFVILGVMCGLFSTYFSKVYFYVSDRFEKVKSARNKVVIGGVILGVLVFLLPPLFGEGLQTINLLIEEKQQEILTGSYLFDYRSNFWIMIGFLTLVMFIKPIATSVTFGAGGVGGIFAPTLFMGGLLGFIFSKLINYLGIGEISVSNFSLVSMAGLMAGILRAPLTAIFLIAEITGGYELFVPLMVTASIGYITAKYFLPHSVYNMQLAQRGELITHHKDQAVLTLMKLHKEIETNFETVTPEMSLGELVKVVSKSKRNIFPVLDDENQLIGIVTLDDIREIMFKIDMYAQSYVSDLMVPAPGKVCTEDTMDEVMKKFEISGAWNLPVLDHGKYVGFVSKSKLFSAYRQQLRDFYDDDDEGN